MSVFTKKKFTITVEGENVALSATHWESSGALGFRNEKFPVLVFIHQWGLLGGSSSLMEGMARQAAAMGVDSITFDLRGVGESTGSRSWTNFSETRDAAAVIQYVEDTLHKNVYLIGSSAGAPVAGYLLDSSPAIIGGTFVGYVWGCVTSIVFGWAYRAIAESKKPKLFVVGDRDEFTSLPQYESRIGALSGDKNEMRLLSGKNHFEIEGPTYDRTVVSWTIDFISEVLSDEQYS
jgi:alpha/beta superfamily hydrolase